MALQNPAIACAIENSAPGLQFAHPIGSLFGVEFRHLPVVDVLTAAHGIGEVDLPVIAAIHIAQCGGNSAFGHDRVGFAQQRFANQTDLATGGGCFNSST
jgi:hypothetical protein